ncbi:hypothetical protein NXV80_17805 [Bacteroides ovatus]|nr:hypothetical protein [Bacteroides ovatus]
MDRFKELGIDTHGRTSGKMKTKCPWCHAQRTDKRDKSLSVNLDTKLYLCHYCGAHGSAAIYAGKGRKLGDPLVKFPTATGSNSSCPPTEKPHGDPEQGALTQKQIEWCRGVRHIPPEVLVEAGVAFALHLDAYIRKGERLGKEGLSLLQLFRKRGIGEHEVPRLTKAFQITARSAHHPLQHRRHPRHAGVHPRGRGI